VVDVAKIFAIEILPGNSGPTLSMNFQYLDGTPVAGSLTYTISSSLLSFSGNAPLVNGQVRCALLANSSAMGISMQFTVAATLADSTGHSPWTLNMGMNPSQLNLAAVQQIHAYCCCSENVVRPRHFIRRLLFGELREAFGRGCSSGQITLGNFYQWPRSLTRDKAPDTLAPRATKALLAMCLERN
jgi:hypothetical protein